VSFLIKLFKLQPINLILFYVLLSLVVSAFFYNVLSEHIVCANLGLFINLLKLRRCFEQVNKLFLTEILAVLIIISKMPNQR